MSHAATPQLSGLYIYDCEATPERERQTWRAIVDILFPPESPEIKGAGAPTIYAPAPVLPVMTPSRPTSHGTGG